MERPSACRAHYFKLGEKLRPVKGIDRVSVEALSLHPVLLQVLAEFPAGLLHRSFHVADRCHLYSLLFGTAKP